MKTYCKDTMFSFFSSGMHEWLIDFKSTMLSTCEFYQRLWLIGLIPILVLCTKECDEIFSMKIIRMFVINSITVSVCFVYIYNHSLFVSIHCVWQMFICNEHNWSRMLIARVVETKNNKQSNKTISSLLCEIRLVKPIETRKKIPMKEEKKKTLVNGRKSTNLA